MKDQATLVEFFRGQNGVLRFSRMLKAGFHPDVLKALEKKGMAEKIGRGVYRLSGASPIVSDNVRALIQAGKGVICLISALSFYGVTDEIPRKVDIAIMRGMRANKIEFPPVQFYRFGTKEWNAGVEEHLVEGRKIKIYSLSKTIADCFKFRNRIGTDTAVSALKNVVKGKKAVPAEIMKYAKICRVDRVIKPFLEAVI